MRAFALALLFLLAALPARAQFLPSPPADAITLAPRPGVTLRYVAYRPEGRPRAAAILFVGGRGTLNLPGRVGPTWQQEGNFLSRSREHFRRAGIFVAIPDAPSDRSGGLGAGRITQEYAADIAALVADVRRRAGPVQLWLIGTSAGTLSAANAAGLAPGVDGVVLTATVTRRGRADNDMGGTSIEDVDLARIRVPVLIAHHRADGCVASPFAGAQGLRARLTSALQVEFMAFEGGDTPRSGPCDALAPHGFLGIEGEVVAWIASRMTGLR